VKFPFAKLQKPFVLLGLVGILIAALTACSDSTAPTTPPKSTDYCSENQSLACKMVIWRYQQFSNPDRYGYFYGFVQGVPQPVVEYVVQGAVFPVNDMVTPPDYQEPCQNTGSGACAVVRQRQQPDGTWGTNGDALFGKLADGTYFEWLGPYAYSFQPLAFQPLKVIGCPTGKHIEGC